jgi:hypothetical protein
VAIGKSIRIYLADGNVAGVRHGEIANWTGQAIACPRSRFSELKDWHELKRPGIYFLFGQNEESEQDAVYIGEAENVLDRIYAHVSGKGFWSEIIAFTSKDDNLTKGHARYLESRIFDLANLSGRYLIENSASPQRPSLPRSDRDAMEEFINGISTLLGVLGHKVLEPLVDRKNVGYEINTIPSSSNLDKNKQQNEVTPTSLINQAFQLRVGSLIANAVRTDEGLVVLAESDACSHTQSSFSLGYKAIRERLLSSQVLVENGAKYKFARDQLFRSPSQAAALVVGYAINGRDAWKTSTGLTFAEFENQINSVI